MFDWTVPRAGISFAPLLEWALAAHWWGLGWHDWQAIDLEDQAFMIAVFRCSAQIDAVLAKYSRPSGRPRPRPRAPEGGG